MPPRGGGRAARWPWTPLPSIDSGAICKDEKLLLKLLAPVSWLNSPAAGGEIKTALSRPLCTSGIPMQNLHGNRPRPPTHRKARVRGVAAPIADSRR